MPKVYNLEDQWSRPLSKADLLRVAEELALLADHDGAPILEAGLRDGSKLRGARTVAELRAELDAEIENDIQSITIALGYSRTAVTWLEWQRGRSVSLKASGEIEAKVHGTFGPMKRRIDSRFEAIDRGDGELTSNSSRRIASADPVVGNVGVTIGSISAGSLAVSGSGLASASSSPPAEPLSRWWRQAWITVGAPIVVLVIGGIILALVLGH